MLDDIKLFTFTADHEEPCCHMCDFQATCAGTGVKCGPEYGWLRYQRTVERSAMTKPDEKLIKLLVEYYKDLYARKNN